MLQDVVTRWNYCEFAHVNEMRYFPTNRKWDWKFIERDIAGHPRPYWIPPGNRGSRRPASCLDGDVVGARLWCSSGNPFVL